MARLGKDKNLPLGLSVNSNGFYWYRAECLGQDRDVATKFAQKKNSFRGVSNPTEPKPELCGPVNTSGTLDVDYILGLAKPVEMMCAVYFLIHEKRIVYVGQSINCILRIGNHLKDPSKVFDSFSIVECDEKNLDELEAKYIARFRPRYNLAIPKSARS